MLKPVASSKTTWTIDQLTELKELNTCFRGDLIEVAEAVRRTRAECDVALFALMGRSPAAAHIALTRPVQGVAA